MLHPANVLHVKSFTNSSLIFGRGQIISIDTARSQCILFYWGTHICNLSCSAVKPCKTDQYRIREYYCRYTGIKLGILPTVISSRMFSLVGTGTMGPGRLDTPAYLAYRTSLSACSVLIATRCAAPRCMLSVLCARIWMLATICVSTRYTVERCYCIHPCAERALPWCLRCLEHHQSLVLEHTSRPTLFVRACVPTPAL